MRISIEYFRKVLSLTLAIIMVTGSVSFVFPQSSPIPQAFAANANLFISAENTMFSNTFAGASVVEIVVVDSDINTINSPVGEPDVTVNGNAIRMAQAVDGNWYAYIADKSHALMADSLSSLDGKGLDFGKFCSSSTTPSALGISIADTTGVAIPTGTGITGGVDGTGLGTPSLSSCTGNASAGGIKNHVTREYPTLNTDPGAAGTGQIGIDVNVWPLVQLYDFNIAGNVVIQYNKGGGVQTTTLTFDTVDQYVTIVRDRITYTPNSQIKLTLTDVALNIDPTDYDVWTFGASITNSTTFYQLFDENGATDADGTSGAVDISSSLFNLMFEDSGQFTLSGANLTNVLTIRDNDDQQLPTDDPLTDINTIGTDGGSISAGSIPVTFVESNPSSGVFVNYDENDKANIIVRPDATPGEVATATYTIGNTILVDIQPVKVTIISPLNGTISSNSTLQALVLYNFTSSSTIIPEFNVVNSTNALVRNQTAVDLTGNQGDTPVFNFSEAGLAADTYTVTAKAKNSTNYEIIDSDTIFYTITSNSPPIANNDFYKGYSDTLLNVAAPGVLANDTGILPLSAVLVLSSSTGVLNLNSDGSFDFTPPAGFQGTAFFNYNATDGTEMSNTALVTLDVIKPFISFTKPSAQYVVGENLFLQVSDQLVNNPSVVDTVLVNLSSTPGTIAPVLLTETGANTATFINTTPIILGTDITTSPGAILSATYQGQTATAKVTFLGGGVPVNDDNPITLTPSVVQIEDATQVRVFDPLLAGNLRQDVVMVFVSSTSDPAGITFSVNEDAGDTGLFTNNLVTLTSAASDSALKKLYSQVGDVVTVTYAPLPSWLLSDTFGTTTRPTSFYGSPTDIPVTGDWNNDGIDDIGFYTPSTGIWTLSNDFGASTFKTTAKYGSSTDTPVTGDWNGDGIDDIGVYRSSQGRWILSTNWGASNSNIVYYGTSADKPVTGNWDNIGGDSIGFYTPSTGIWTLSNDFGASTFKTTAKYGSSTDTPVTGDWNGDGIDDIGVYRSSQGRWILSTNWGASNSNIVYYGTSADKPVTGNWDNIGGDSIGRITQSIGTSTTGSVIAQPVAVVGIFDATLAEPETCNEFNNQDGVCSRFIADTGGLEIELASGATYTKTCDVNDSGLAGINDSDCPSSETLDVFVEIDWMTNRAPSQEAIDQVVASFRNSPLVNINGDTGVNIHVLLDEDIGRFDPLIRWNDLTPGDEPSFAELKSAYFGTADERLQGQDVLEAKAQVYRYVLFVNQITEDPFSSGVGEIGGNDIAISMGAFSGGVGSVDEQAGTLFHELGHTMGLIHGGSDDLNCKPNYQSVMNYNFQFPTTKVDGQFVPTNRPLDFSRVTLPSLDESSLDESLGIKINAGNPVLNTVVGGITSAGAVHTPAVIPTGSAFNFDRDAIENEIVSQNIHYRDIGGCRDSSVTTLYGYDDWSNIDLNFRDSSNFLFGDQVHTDIIGLGELSADNVELTVPAPDVDTTTPTANSITKLTSVAAPIPITLTGATSSSTNLQFNIVTPPQFGNLDSLNPPNIDATSAQVLYTPGPGFATDSFTFTVTRTDGALITSSIATVDIVLNTPPVADDINLGTTLDIPLPIVLSASDPQNNPITIIRTSDVLHGTLSGLVQAGNTASLTYTPNLGYLGADSFTYKAVDSFGENSNIATVTINVLAPTSSSVPSATGSGTVEFSTDSGGIESLVAISEDDLPVLGKPLGMTFDYGLFSYDVSGIIPGSTAVITITYPSAIPANSQYWKIFGDNWVNATSLLGSNDGDEIITLTITDGGFGDEDGVADGQILDPSGVAMVDSIVANDQTIQILEDTADVEIVLTADPQTNPLTFTILSQQNANLGTFIQDSLDSSKVTYIPFANKNGQDILAFSATDGTVTSNDGTITINVTPVNDIPTVPAIIEVSVIENQPKTFVITASDVDTFDETDPDYLGFQLTSIPTSKGQITSITNIDATSAEFVYTPNAGATGTDTFTYYVTDRSGVSSDVGTVNLTIEPIVVPPTPLTLQEKKQDAIGKLDALDPSNTRTEKLVDNAIRHITKSASDELWNADEDSVDQKHGKKVFNEEAIAVKNLMKILMKSSADDDDWDEGLDDNEFSDDSDEQGEFEISSAVSSSIQEIIDLLVGIDKKLADDAIAEASSHALSLSGKDKKKADKHLEEITKSMQQAQEKLDDGKLHQAILKYKKAWENAQSILKL